jgi:cupin 2 domain-containing protein
MKPMNSPAKKNILENIPSSIPAEIFETILQTQHLRVERIISRGQKSDADFWYEQEQAEWVLVIKGAARIQFENHFVELQAGDYINIEPHQKHRLDWTTPDAETVWLAVFY